MYKNLQILRENPETANAGKKWTEEEIIKFKLFGFFLNLLKT